MAHLAVERDYVSGPIGNMIGGGRYVNYLRLYPGYIAENRDSKKAILPLIEVSLAGCFTGIALVASAATLIATIIASSR
ncbi:MAG: hypothetical protein ACD_12C00713G0001 [uncultured bacterium]|nr:MAG: hypothetical protein ACD_12C00713G0001 [uncultured bacterium]